MSDREDVRTLERDKSVHLVSKYLRLGAGRKGEVARSANLGTNTWQIWLPGYLELGG